MIRPTDRKIAYWLVRLKIWKIEPDWLWSIPRIKTAWGTQWLLAKMLRAQSRDRLHHAPACPGNEWDGQYLVLFGCNCGTKRQARKARAISSTHLNTPGEAK